MRYGPTNPFMNCLKMYLNSPIRTLHTYLLTFMTVFVFFTFVKQSQSYTVVPSPIIRFIFDIFTIKYRSI